MNTIIFDACSFQLRLIRAEVLQRNHTSGETLYNNAIFQPKTCLASSSSYNLNFVCIPTSSNHSLIRRRLFNIAVFLHIIYSSRTESYILLPCDMRRPLGHNYSQKNQMFSRAHEDKNVSTVMLFLLFKCCFEDRSVVQTILIFYFSITKLKLILIQW